MLSLGTTEEVTEGRLSGRSVEVTHRKERRAKVLIEVDSQERDGIRLSEKGIAHDLKEEFQAVVNLAKTTALSAHYTYVNIPEPARPDELELTFGVKISSEAGVVFARLASEGSFQITMRWK